MNSKLKVSEDELRFYVRRIAKELLFLLNGNPGLAEMNTMVAFNNAFKDDLNELLLHYLSTENV